MGSEYITSDFCQSPIASNCSDFVLKIKSEPGSVEEINDSHKGPSCEGREVSPKKSVTLPDYKRESDIEDVLDEPLVDINLMTVSQQLVQVEQDPSLLLFVNREANSIACSRSGMNITKRQLSEEDSANRNAITRALRNVKRKSPIKRQDSYMLQLVRDKATAENMAVVGCDNDSNYHPDHESCHASSIESSLLKNSKLHLKSNKKYVKVRKKRRPSHQRIRLMVLKRGKTKRSVKISKNKSSSAPFNFLTDDVTKDLELHYDETQHEGKENTQNNNEENNSSSKNNSNTIYTKRKQKQGSSNNSNDKNSMIEMEKPESYDCIVCDKKFKKKSHLATHSRAHIEIRNFKCDECGNMYKTKTNLRFHKKTHEEAPFTCEKCNKTYPERKILKRHIRVVHSGEGKFKCGDCGRSFKSARNLELHFTLHLGNKPFSCNVCGKTFVYKSTYTIHMKAHDAENAFSCDQCPRGMDKAELRRTCNHLSDMRPWLCTVCGKAYPLKATLKNHMKTHEPQKPYHCTDCGKTFVKKSSYECHIKTHTGETPQFMCDQCSLSYFNAFALKRHYVKHTGERRFVCDLCDKAFWMKDALRVHRKSHAGEKTHPCDRCSKSFAHKHTLVAHLRTHLHVDDQGFACPLRQKAFVHKYNADHHEIGPLPPLHTGFPLPPSLIMLAPPKHIEVPTLHIL